MPFMFTLRFLVRTGRHPFAFDEGEIFLGYETTNADGCDGTKLWTQEHEGLCLWRSFWCFAAARERLGWV